MTWRELAFIHYPVPVAEIARRLPAGLAVDRFDGQAWLGIVPFRMAQVAPRGLPPMPGLSTFPEINLRTYVIADGKPGVWFFSLDATSWLTVLVGWRLFDLPYFDARIAMTPRVGGFDFASQRRGAAAEFRGRYRPRGTRFQAEPGTFEHWATERYCLYAHSPRRGLRRLEVHHPPWPLQAAEVEVEACTLPAAFGLPPLTNAPVCHFSPGVPVVSFGPERLLSDTGANRPPRR